jgi:hypothetical protein
MVIVGLEQLELMVVIGLVQLVVKLDVEVLLL